MSQYEFRIATLEDDSSLRELLAATPMEGQIRLSFAREPSYFASTRVDGAFVQIVAACERRTGRIVGMGSRSVSPCYVNGRVTDVGYLSALRLLPEFRGQGRLLARGYQFFHQLHKDGRAAYYLTAIAEGNQAALKLLTSQRAGLPIYHPLGRYHTLVLSPARRRVADSDDLSTRTATREDGSRIAAFLNSEGPSRQFFPAYAASEFFAEPQRLWGLRAEDAVLVHRDGRLVGVLGAWDQRAFKQTVVSGYAPWLGRLRLVYNGVAAVRGRTRLPRAGTSLNSRCAVLGVVAEGEKCPTRLAAFRRLVETAAAMVARQGCQQLLVGLHESDPWLPWLQNRAGAEYVTRLFLVYWPEDPPDIRALQARTPYLELGCL